MSIGAFNHQTTHKCFQIGSSYWSVALPLDVLGNELPCRFNMKAAPQFSSLINGQVSTIPKQPNRCPAVLSPQHLYCRTIAAAGSSRMSTPTRSSTDAHSAAILLVLSRGVYATEKVRTWP